MKSGTEFLTVGGNSDRTVKKSIFFFNQRASKLIDLGDTAMINSKSL